MKIAISATNPCHLYDMALALHERGVLGVYFSGYPRFRLGYPDGFPAFHHSFRTLVTYGLLRLPLWMHPASSRLFRWQDRGFDEAVAKTLRREHGDVLHAMPGQALHSFRAAKRLGIATCLNHASGPIRERLAMIRDEYARTGQSIDALLGYDKAYFEQEDEEYRLSDYHCVASSIVRDQLIALGIGRERILLVPYGASDRLFFPPAADTRRAKKIVYAGQLTLRKNLKTLFAAFQIVKKQLRDPELTLELYGRPQADIAPDLQQSAEHPDIHFHGAVPAAELADAFRKASLLVLPSLEEAFGLVVVQALNCGLPCIVSNRVGAKDLIEHHENGSVFEVTDAESLASEICWWLQNPNLFRYSSFTWSKAAEQMMRLHAGLETCP